MFYLFGIVPKTPAHVAYSKHNTEDVKTGPKKPREHKSLVLTLPSAPARFIHASIRIPVRMPLKSCPETSSRYQARPRSPRRLA